VTKLLAAAVATVVGLVGNRGDHDVAHAGVPHRSRIHVGRFRLLDGLLVLDRGRDARLLGPGHAVLAEELGKGLGWRTGAIEGLLSVVVIVVVHTVAGPAVADSAMMIALVSGLGTGEPRTLRTARRPRHNSRRAVLVVAIAVGAGFGREVLKVRVVAGLLGRDAAGGVVDE